MSPAGFVGRIQQNQLTALRPISMICINCILWKTFLPPKTLLFRAADLSLPSPLLRRSARAIAVVVVVTLFLLPGSAGCRDAYVLSPHNRSTRSFPPASDPSSPPDRLLLLDTAFLDTTARISPFKNFSIQSILSLPIDDACFQPPTIAHSSCLAREVIPDTV
ncbi:hypothetical protein OUZ56_026530 [Daphnia magna]|uniref:Uncharacterized protein n=1 Tax=Daphnia magna TaxID=35525 RepID=A0ABQ9ZM20_9CRUS|nr:hypothetical protein OUZ56_026530 [Daphnia magna]